MTHLPRAPGPVTALRADGIRPNTRIPQVCGFRARQPYLKNLFMLLRTHTLQQGVQSRRTALQVKRFVLVVLLRHASVRYDTRAVRKDRGDLRSIVPTLSVS